MRTLAMTLIILSACADNPADKTPSATVTDPQAAEKPTPAPAEPAKPTTAAKEPEADGAVQAAETTTGGNSGLKLSGHIHFTGSKVTGSHTCRFERWQGLFTPGANGELATSKLEFSVEANSAFCDWDDRSKWTAKFEKHLISKDFFNAAEHPTTTFVSKSLVTDSAGTTITGDLTLRGITKEIRFPAEVVSADGKFSGKAKFDINRKDWGVNYPGKPDNLIREEVVLEIQLSGG